MAKHKIELDEADVKEALAKHYGVLQTQVDLHVAMGYDYLDNPSGHVVTATIRLPMVPPARETVYPPADINLEPRG